MVLLKHLLVFLAALFAGAPVLSLGLVVSGVVVLPLAFLVVAVVVAVAALWVGNGLDRGRTQGRLVPVLVVSLATAGVVVGLTLVFSLVAPPLAYAPPVFLLIFGAATVSINAAVTTWRFREEGRSLRRDALFSSVVLVFAAAILVAVVFSTCSLGYCGA